MNNTNTTEPTKVPGKKEMRKQVVDKIEAALPELKSPLGEKKFHNRVKKAAKLITGGLDKEERAKVTKKTKTAKAATLKTKALKKKAKSASKPE